MSKISKPEGRVRKAPARERLEVFAPLPEGLRDENKTKARLIQELKSLRKRVNRSRFLFDNTNDGIFLYPLDADGKGGPFWEVNESARRKLGYGKAEFLGLRPDDINSPGSRPRLRKLFRKLRNKGRCTIELTHVAKDGKEFPVEASSHLFPLHGRKMVLSLVRDITERKQAEEALRVSERRYRELYRMVRLMCDNVPDMIWAKDREKKYLFVNRAICEQLLNTGDSDTPVGKTDMYFAEKERRARPEKPDWHSFGEICTDSDEEVMRNKTAQRFDEFGNVRGKLLYLDVHKAPFWDEEGRMIGTVGCGRNVTREKKLEEEHRRAEQELARYRENLEKIVGERTARIQELEQQRLEIEKWGATGHLAARVAHEINNPLAGIKGSFLLIKDAVSPDHQYYPYLGRIEKEIERIARIVRQVFDLYRPQEESKGDFCIEKTIRDVVSLLEEETRAQKVVFDLKIGPAVLKIPENSVRQVLFNIIKNAVEASPRDGVVSVETKSRDGFLTVHVADEGGGIPPEMRPQVFKPFFTTKKRGQRGLGLGLSISRDILQGLGGGIEFDGASGGGTVFKIRLPWRLGRKGKET